MMDVRQHEHGARRLADHRHRHDRLGDDARAARRHHRRAEDERARRGRGAAARAEAQLASIESRVQPHFLFNTLNSIAALVHDDPAGAERMTGQLAALLRSALDSTATPLVPLDEELRVVRAYLEIERVRFGDRLRYRSNCGDGGAGARAEDGAADPGREQRQIRRLAAPLGAPRSSCARTRPTAASASRSKTTVRDSTPRPAGRPRAGPAGRRLAMLFADRASLGVASRPGQPASSSTCPTTVRLKPDTTYGGDVVSASGGRSVRLQADRDVRSVRFSRTVTQCALSSRR